MAKSETKTNLGKLCLGKNAVFVSLLPTGTTAIVVSYSPNVILSCAVMPNEFDIECSVVGAAKKDRLRVKTPHLFMGLAYNDVPFSTYPSVKNQCNLWALNIDRTDGIYVKPYRLANVWETGGVCFGNLSPVSLRQAFNYYWTSLFNDDIPVPHICKNKKHYYEWHNGCLCDGSAKKHECDCLKITFHKHVGCGCTTVKKSIKCSKNKTKCLNASQCICCLAIEQLHNQNPKEKRKAVALKELAPDEAFPYCGCSWRHLRHCPCKKNKCLCKCECLCCNKKCSHQECECSCCRNTCACPCKCSKKQRLLQQFTSYNEDIFNFGRWENATKLVCGDKYWASPKGAEGVLISRNRALLNVIPRKFWRSSKFGSMVIALANRTPRGWYFESGSFTFYIDYKNVANR